MSVSSSALVGAISGGGAALIAMLVMTRRLRAEGRVPASARLVSGQLGILNGHFRGTRVRPGMGRVHLQRHPFWARDEQVELTVLAVRPTGQRPPPSRWWGAAPWTRLVQLDVIGDTGPAVVELALLRAGRELFLARQTPQA